MKRFAILVREYGTDQLVELCQCDSNPEQIADGARQKYLKTKSGRRWLRIPKYSHVEVIDREASSS